MLKIQGVAWLSSSRVLWCVSKSLLLKRLESCILILGPFYKMLPIIRLLPFASAKLSLFPFKITFMF